MQHVRIALEISFGGPFRGRVAPSDPLSNALPTGGKRTADRERAPRAYRTPPISAMDTVVPTDVCNETPRTARVSADLPTRSYTPEASFNLFTPHVSCARGGGRASRAKTYIGGQARVNQTRPVLDDSKKKGGARAYPRTAFADENATLSTPGV